MNLKSPMIIVNFKTYLESTGKKSMELAQIADKVAKETGASIIVVPQLADIAKVAETVEIPVFAQHVDPIRPGNCTGQILIESVKEAGVAGTLINHSERQLKLSDIESIIMLLKEKDMVSCVCANNPLVSAAITAMRPDIVSIEPPELIGSGIAVSRAKPEVITDTVKLVHKIESKMTILCGAGISQAQDVSVALQLGTQGVLVASGIVRAKDPYSVLRAFADSIIQ